MKKIEINDLFQSLERFGINREEIFADQTLKILRLDWNQIVGDVLGDASYPSSLKDGKLLVICKHSMVSQELDFARSEIVKKIGEKKMPILISKIIFRAGNSPNLKK
jgi:predicted nucleic acid-binding Zn ribbon protein